MNDDLEILKAMERHEIVDSTVNGSLALRYAGPRFDDSLAAAFAHRSGHHGRRALALRAAIEALETERELEGPMIVIDPSPPNREAGW